MISAAHVEQKGRLISLNLALFNEKWQSILQGFRINFSHRFATDSYEFSQFFLPGVSGVYQFAIECALSPATEQFQSGLSATGSLENFVQNHQVLREISLILRVNERMVVAVGTACHAQLANIYCALISVGTGGLKMLKLPRHL